MLWIICAARTYLCHTLASLTFSELIGENKQTKKLGMKGKTQSATRTYTRTLTHAYTRARTSTHPRLGKSLLCLVARSLMNWAL